VTISLLRLILLPQRLGHYLDVGSVRLVNLDYLLEDLLGARHVPCLLSDNPVWITESATDPQDEDRKSQPPAG
jgi:hypothetical protein